MSEWDFLWGLDGQELEDAITSGGTAADWAFAEEQEIEAEEQKIKALQATINVVKQQPMEDYMAGIQKTCKDCGTELNKDDKHGLCDECRAARRAKWKSRFKTGAKIAVGIGAAVGLIYLVSKSSDEDSDSFPYVDFDDDANDTVETDTGSSEVPEHAPGEKYWNSRTQNWELDGKPYTYRLTYKDARDGEIHTHDYGDVDNGYEDYEYYRKRWYTSQVEWDHVPPSED